MPMTDSIATKLIFTEADLKMFFSIHSEGRCYDCDSPLPDGFPFEIRIRIIRYSGGVVGPNPMSHLCKRCAIGGKAK